jgi:hypothetical protein
MNIFDHIIPDSAILGIGPLMLQYTTDPAQEALYASRRYFFDLHLSAHTTRVESDWFRVRESVEEQQRMHAWREQYLKARERIAMMIGEPTDESKAHEAAVNSAYDNSKHILEDFDTMSWFSDLNTSAKLKFHRLHDNIDELKKLALK